MPSCSQRRFKHLLDYRVNQSGCRRRSLTRLAQVVHQRMARIQFQPLDRQLIVFIHQTIDAEHIPIGAVVFANQARRTANQRLALNHVAYPLTQSLLDPLAQRRESVSFQRFNVTPPAVSLTSPTSSRSNSAESTLTSL